MWTSAVERVRYFRVCAHMPRVLTVCVERYVVRGRKTWVRSFFSHIVGLNIQTLGVPLASRL